MKNLEFRAWDCKREKFIQDIDNIFIDSDGDVFEFLDICYEHYMKKISNRVIVEQYTGVTDKNAVKIFDGDLALFRNKIYKVVWNYCGSLMWECVNKDDDFPLMLQTLRNKCKVIGNIHQNKDLIK